MDITFVCKSATVKSDWNRNISVDIEGADISDILECFELKYTIKALGTSKFLDAIGMEECMDYFDLIENTQDE
jgi:hypothetical protein